MIEGLETLTNLREIYLFRNRISEIKGLETLIKLHTLKLNDNPIGANEIHLVNIFGLNAQEVVKYCQEKANKAKSDS